MQYYFRQAESDRQLEVSYWKRNELVNCNHMRQNEDKSYRTVLIRYSYSTLIHTYKEIEIVSCCPLHFH